MLYYFVVENYANCLNYYSLRLQKVRYLYFRFWEISTFRNFSFHNKFWAIFVGVTDSELLNAAN